MKVALKQFRLNFFKVMAHPLRIQIIELLSESPKSVNELQLLLECEGSIISQHLSILRTKHIVRGIKDGNRVVYSIQDPLIKELFEMTKTIFINQLKSVIQILDP